MKKAPIAKPFNILMADDDADDRFFFKKALSDSGLPFTLKTCVDGEELMKTLQNDEAVLPDVLFLDLNMPKRGGEECLRLIKATRKLQSLPVVIYSTVMDDESAVKLFELGAHYYIRKSDYADLIQVLSRVFSLLAENNFRRPERERFIVTPMTA